MRSLFSKILLWFVAMVAITWVGFFLTTAHNITYSDDRLHPMARLVPFQFAEARHEYESGGRQHLAAFMERLRAAFPAAAFLTDASGKDLETGEDRSELLRTAAKRRRFSLLNLERLVIVHQSEDGQYWFLLLIPRRGWALWFFQPRYLWVLGIAVVFCYGLALYLTAPLRRLQHAVEEFGRGRLGARVRSTRRDEVGQLAETFDRMADRIETLRDAERRLLVDISHELRSPLARLGVAVELARGGEGLDAALSRIQKEADRLNELVGGLLQVTRGEGDPSALRQQEVRLEELLKTLEEDCSIEARERGCRIELRAPAPAVVRGDPELLRRAVENVLRNAIRYAPAGTAVEMRLELEESRAKVAIRDYGPGVPEDSLPRLFDAFYRAETGRERSRGGGVGLGLSIARRAVELHQGTITAHNAAPGLLVEICLPELGALTA